MRGLGFFVVLGVVFAFGSIAGCARPVPKWNPAVLTAAQKLHKGESKEEVDNTLQFPAAQVSNMNNSAMLDLKTDEPTIGYQYEILEGNILLVVFKKKDLTVLYTYPDPLNMKGQ